MHPPTAHHSLGSWKHPRNVTQSGRFEWDSGEVWREVALSCERGKLDFVFAATTEAARGAYRGNDYRASVQYGIKCPSFDPAVLMPYMSHGTRHIGLVGTMGTLPYPPYVAARMWATFDHITNGRVGWNVVTGFDRRAAQNLGLEDVLDHDERYERAEEYLDLCYRLWESWEPDAVEMDIPGDVFANPDKVHEVNFQGTWFQSRGPLNVHSSPQGRVTIAQAGMSQRGIEFAAKHASLVFSVQTSRHGMKRYRDTLRTAVERAGRDPDSVKVCFGVQIIVSETDELARMKAEHHNSMVSAEAGLAYLSGNLGVDLASVELDDPISSLGLVPGTQGFIDQYVRFMGTPDVSIRDVARDHGKSTGTPQVVGAPNTVADWMIETMEEVGGDGFMISPIYVPGSVEELVDLVVPRLQAAGVARREYSRPLTLRELLQEKVET